MKEEAPAACDPLCHDDVLLLSLVETLKQYVAADNSSVVAVEPLSLQLFQLPVTAAGRFAHDEGAPLSQMFLPLFTADERFASDRGEPLSPQVFLLPIVADVSTACLRCWASLSFCQCISPVG